TGVQTCALPIYDVYRSLADVIAFDVAMEVETALAQELGRPLHDLVALDDFFADVEQTYGGLFALIERAHQRRAHDGKLQQMFCRAVDVRAKIEHRGGAALDVGNGSGNGRTVDAVERLEQIARDRHERAGVPRRHAGVGPAVLDGLDRDAHGRVLLAPQRRFHGVVHEDDFGGRQYFIPARL